MEIVDNLWKSMRIYGNLLKSVKIHPLGQQPAASGQPSNQPSEQPAAHRQPQPAASSQPSQPAKRR